MDILASSAAVPDVLALRRDIYAKGVVTRDDLSRLLEIARAGLGGASDDLDAFVAEVAADLVVGQAEPTRYVSGEDADWLINALVQRGLPSTTRQRLLGAVLSHAVSVPGRLAAFAVGSIEQTIVDERRVVTAADVEALRAAVFAATDTSALHVTRESADALFRIADATRGADNDPAFVDFFARAVGDHLLSIPFRWTPSAADEVRKEQWLDAEPAGMGEFLGRMFGAGDRSLTAADLASPVEAEEALVRQENEADARGRSEAQIIDEAEARWLLTRLGTSEPPTPAERALLGFLGREASAMPPDLRALVDREAA